MSFPLLIGLRPSARDGQTLSASAPAGCAASLRWPGLAEPPPAPLLAVGVLAFPYFSFLELGVGVHASCALHPLL